MGLSVKQEIEGYLCISNISGTIDNLIYVKKVSFENTVLFND